MKEIAYIIVAHQDPRQLKRLIDSLDSNADFYVHIDRKVQIEPFETELRGAGNVFFTKERIRVHWGSFGQVLAQKELLRNVFESDTAYGRIVALSGMDYPVFSANEILDKFRSNRQMQYIMGYNLSKTRIKHQIERVTVYHFFRDLKVNSKLIKGIFSRPSLIFMKLLPIRKNKKVYFSEKLSDIYMGSDMWSLTYDCAKYVYQTMCREKSLMNYFRYSFAPSEMVVQTIVFNSRFSEQTIAYEHDDYQGLITLAPLHYFEYGKSIKVFDESDFNKIISSGKMFFRKALTGKSDELIALMEKHRSRSHII